MVPAVVIAVTGVTVVAAAEVAVVLVAIPPIAIRVEAAIVLAHIAVAEAEAEAARLRNVSTFHALSVRQSLLRKLSILLRNTDLAIS